MELSLLIRGLKLFGSLLNVISNSDRKRFIPASRLWGLRRKRRRKVSHRHGDGSFNATNRFLTCWPRSSWREYRRTRWLCRPGRSPWWSRAPPRRRSSWHGGCTCTGNTAQLDRKSRKRKQKEDEEKREQPLDDSGGHQSLLRVQVRRRLVDQVNVSRFPQTQSESDSLQLTTGQVLHLRGEEEEED